MEILKKKVSFPIFVPKEPYCFKAHAGVVCQYFNNETGLPRCDLRIGILKYAPGGFVIKPDECEQLEEA